MELTKRRQNFNIFILPNLGVFWLSNFQSEISPNSIIEILFWKKWFLQYAQINHYWSNKGSFFAKECFK